ARAAQKAHPANSEGESARGARDAASAADALVDLLRMQEDNRRELSSAQREMLMGATREAIDMVKQQAAGSGHGEVWRIVELMLKQGGSDRSTSDLTAVIGLITAQMQEHSRLMVELMKD